MLHRDRQERVALWRLELSAKALLSGISPENVKKLVKALCSEAEDYIFQTVYSSDYLRQRLLDEMAELYHERDRMRRIAALGA